MKILIASSEMAPFVNSGGLADFVQGLASQLGNSGHEVTVVLPFFRAIRENKALGAKRSKVRFSVRVGAENLPCEVWEASCSKGVKLKFIQRDEYFDRTGLYGTDGRDYQDNAARFIFFSKCVTELARINLPDAVHLIGWQAALAAVFIHDQKISVPTVLFPFSLEYQGNFWSHDFALTNLPEAYFSSQGLEFYGSMNFLKAGIVFANAVALPGGRFVAEAQTPAHGCGLENVLREHSKKLEGIAFGIEEHSLPASKSDAKARAAACREFFPAADPSSARVFIIDTLSTSGVGIDIALQVMDLLPSSDFFVAMFGPIEEKFREAIEIALRRHAGRFIYLSETDSPVVSRLISAGNFILVPGPLDPQRIFLAVSMKNGLIPVVEFCAGLPDLVRDFDRVTGSGNGLVYYKHSRDSLADAIKRAHFLPSGEMDILSRRARDTDFSWKPAIARLEEMQHRLLQKTRQAAA